MSPHWLWDRSVSVVSVWLCSLILFRYLHTLWGCSTKPFTKWLSCCGGKWSCILCFYYLMLTICSVTYYGPCGVILISFRYLHTLWCCLLNTGKLSEWVKDNGLKLQIMRRVGRWGITIPSKAFFSLLCLSI